MSDMQDIRVKAQRAHEMISALCKPKGTEGSREWIMSIPARPDYDPDLVLGDAVKALTELADRHDAAVALAKELSKGLEEALTLISIWALNEVPADRKKSHIEEFNRLKALCQRAEELCGKD